ncbi:Coenzyme F420 hydrogenase/dehydrogenase, beta subunit C-terminal domain [Cellulosilyticum sp. I15G10I2]|uniref:Coenzyme F420 hydrogenase/dehydrogenase, beta subunit C-terminal domain n=1 Tax=Cellulosilyticum sp. I15G10I2 TaxID=1892843 RepID=UPI00085C23FB|nr:Coenzyme F420 hydrogenase/dehydrogenase, beta subunit C-terminal domain [Cellulosilyticum sp. I15G10I2]
MIDKIEKILCTGCNSCANACPLKAIDMITDEEGFWYPKVQEKCNQCGICISKCPSLKRKKSNYADNPDVFAAWSKDEHIRYHSTSGGMFTELANQILQDGGYVVGARYINEFMVEHAIINHPSDIHKLRQSKYLQSDISNMYEQVLKLLETEKKILFCGTPCQNAGLAAFLGKPHLNLIQCDFICRGVISPMVYKKYLDMLENRYEQPIKKVIFKNKSRGWNGFCTLIEFENGQQYIEDRNHDLYMVGYLKYNLYLRPCCHKCQYKELPRVSDITLGDFWGIGKTRPHLDENKGTSVVLVNSNKGEALFGKLGCKIVSEQCTIDEVIRGNACLLESAPRGQQRHKFFEELTTNSFDQAFFKAVHQKDETKMSDN